MSRHLKVLERAGLISRGRDAQRRPCRIEGKPLADANAWLEDYRRFWEGSFQRLDTLLDELKTEEINYAHRLGNCADASLRRATPPGLRRVFQARAAQAL